MKKNSVAIEREKIKEDLETKLLSSFETNINIDQEKIKEWKNQFKNN